MRELTYQEVDELSGGNLALYAIPAAGVVAGGIALGSYALNAEQVSGFGLTASFLQGFASGALSTGGWILCTLPGGAAAGIPAIALAGIIDITDPLLSME
jgi:hypothetical protein